MLSPSLTKDSLSSVQIPADKYTSIFCTNSQLYRVNHLVKLLSASCDMAYHRRSHETFDRTHYEVNDANNCHL